ncbi:MAG: IS66 family insertion sequence element accessory protein TnpB [Bacteroidetes bacterium]|nr:IS66 family insertion sequence element accessory protein TnpB [Bacteroidota bacterium]
MFLPTHNLKVYIALGITDMRKSIDGLSILVSEKLKLDLFSGHLFVFCNRNQNMLKILYWDKRGFCLWHKRLEKNKFKWPRSKEEVMAVGTQELSWLINGLNIHQKNAHKSLKYTTVF